MRKHVFYFVAFLAVGGSCLSPAPTRASTYLENFRSKTSILPNEELRAVWVVRHALASQEEIDRAIDYAIRARFHLLFVQVRGRGDAYYRSEIEPVARDVVRAVDEFDPLGYLLMRAHEAGISVHAWVNVYYVWSDPRSEPPPTHIVRRHPEWLMTDANGTRMDALAVDDWRRRGLEGYYVSPSNAAVRKHMVDVISDIVTRYPVDGVHLDYIRYPGLDFDFGLEERTGFMLRYGVDPWESRNDPAYMTELLGENIAFLTDSLRIEWRVQQVDSLIRMVRDVVGDLPLSAAVMPNFGSARIEKGQDWLRWVTRGDVDFVVPMAYGYEPADLTAHVRMIKRTIGAERFLVGLPVFDGRSSYLGYSLSLLRQEGIVGYSLFSYNVLAEEEFSLEFLERVLLEAFDNQ